MEIEAEASRLSYAALSGDTAAVQLHAESNARAAQLTVDRGVPVRAMVTAREIEEKARFDEEEATRLSHLADAKAAAIQLLRTSERADALTKNCADAVTELNEAEGRVRESFRLAGGSINIGRVGRDGIANFLLRNRATAKARSTATCARLARNAADSATGWRHRRPAQSLRTAAITSQSGKPPPTPDIWSRQNIPIRQDAPIIQTKVARLSPMPELHSQMCEA